MESEEPYTVGNFVSDTLDGIGKKQRELTNLISWGYDLIQPKEWMRIARVRIFVNSLFPTDFPFDNLAISYIGDATSGSVCIWLPEKASVDAIAATEMSFPKWVISIETNTYIIEKKENMSGPKTQTDGGRIFFDITRCIQ